MKAPAEPASRLVELAIVPDSDHHATLDNPAGFVNAVRPFLSKA